MARGRFKNYDALSKYGGAPKPVWVCSRPDCETHHNQKQKPETCLRCGGMAFDYFASTSEAQRWAALRLQEKVGVISGLRRQVSIPLMTTAPNGLAVQVATYRADFVYDRDGAHVIEDRKPRSGMDPLAELKIKWVEAQTGQSVLITS
jgi:hypothetical protein